MSITDIDLQFMADSMLEDPLLPGDDAEFSLSEFLSEDLQVEGAADASDTLLQVKPADAPKSSKGKGKSKVDGKRPADPVSGTSAAETRIPDDGPSAAKVKAGTRGKSSARLEEKSGAKENVAGDAGRGKINTRGTAQDKAKDKAKTPQSTSPLSDFYLSSLPASVTRPKLSKSMKGASQNDQKAASSPAHSFEADKQNEPKAVAAPDPYVIPMSPTSKRRSHDKSVQKPKATSPATSVAKMTSPLGLIPASSNRRSKPQKRVAKRSILDAPPFSEEETKVKPEPVHPPPKAPSTAPAPKQTAKSKRKPSVGKERKEAEKGKEKEKEKPAAKQEKTFAKAEKKTPRSFLVPKQVKEEENDTYEIPASFLDIPPAEEVTKKLRPRVERPAIIISSDSETSYSDDDDRSDSAFSPDAGDTTVMTTPDDAADSAGSKRLHHQKKQSLGETFYQDEGTLAGKSHKKSVDRVVSEVVHERGESSRTTILQRQRKVSTMPAAMHSELGEVKPSSFAVKRGTGEPISTRGPEALVMGQGTAQQTVKQGKRPWSPAKTGREGENQKRAKSGRGATTAPCRDAEDADTDHAPHEPQGSSTKVVHSVAASDPFMGNVDEERPQQSHFTTKLLQSAVHPAPSMDTRPAAHHGRSRFSVAATAANQRLAASPGRVSSDITSESSQIACEMMRLLATSRQAEAGRAQGGGEAESTKDIWLSETDPYRETGQVMSYVCKTLLRFLKSKEAAVEDVATEYRQRGGALLARIKDLHKAEMASFAVDFENRRLKSLDVFEEASRGVRQLTASLERVSLVPAINDVLGDNTVARLRALQAESV